MTVSSSSRTTSKQASNGAIAVEMFIGTQLCSNGTECLQGVADGTIDIYISTSGGTAGHLSLRAGARPALPDGRRPRRRGRARQRLALHHQDAGHGARKTSGGAIKLMTIGNTGGWRNFANTQRR
jgi:hypothetical protein